MTRRSWQSDRHQPRPLRRGCRGRTTSRGRSRIESRAPRGVPRAVRPRRGLRLRHLRAGRERGGRRQRASTRGWATGRSRSAYWIRASPSGSGYRAGGNGGADQGRVPASAASTGSRSASIPRTREPAHPACARFLGGGDAPPPAPGARGRAAARRRRLHVVRGRARALACRTLEARRVRRARPPDPALNAATPLTRRSDAAADATRHRKQLGAAAVRR